MHVIVAATENWGLDRNHWYFTKKILTQTSFSWNLCTILYCIAFDRKVIELPFRIGKDKMLFGHERRSWCGVAIFRGIYDDKSSFNGFQVSRR